MFLILIIQFYLPQKAPGSWENFMVNYHALNEIKVHPLLLEAMSVTIAYRQPTPKLTRVYTDDLAPIEWLTNKMVVDYFLSGGLDDLR